MLNYGKRFLPLILLCACQAPVMMENNITTTQTWQRLSCQRGQTAEILVTENKIFLRYQGREEVLKRQPSQQPTIYHNPLSALYHDEKQLLWVSRPREEIILSCPWPQY